MVFILRSRTFVDCNVSCFPLLPSEQVWKIKLFTSEKGFMASLGFYTPYIFATTEINCLFAL